MNSGDMDAIRAVTGDNKGSCLNTRRYYVKKHHRFLGVIDQTHVADLLINDVGKYPWIKDVIDKVANLISDVHHHRKLEEHLRNIMNEYNYVINAASKNEDKDTEDENR